jgi:hypothetical protein
MGIARGTEITHTIFLNHAVIMHVAGYEFPALLWHASGPAVITFSCHYIFVPYISVPSAGEIE